MADLVVIVPSRDRAAAAHDLARTFADTCTADTQLVFAIDERDVAQIYDYPHDNIATTWWSRSTTMGEALNMRAADLLAGDMQTPAVGGGKQGGIAPPFAIGFMGDDHRPRTAGWDSAYLDALKDLGTGIVYGDDLLQREKLPTQCAMTADIVRALGYMSPPELAHMYIDNAWLLLGQAAGCIRYLPDVVVEHVHPVAGKAEWDEGYQRVNAPAVYEADRIALARWQATELPAAAAKVRALRAAP